MGPRSPPTLRQDEMHTGRDRCTLSGSLGVPCLTTGEAASSSLVSLVGGHPVTPICPIERAGGTESTQAGELLYLWVRWSDGLESAYSQLPPEGTKVPPTQHSRLSSRKGFCVGSSGRLLGPSKPMPLFQRPGGPPCWCQIQALPPSALSSPGSRANDAACPRVPLSVLTGPEPTCWAGRLVVSARQSWKEVSVPLSRRMMQCAPQPTPPFTHSARATEHTVAARHCRGHLCEGQNKGPASWNSQPRPGSSWLCLPKVTYNGKNATTSAPTYLNPLGCGAVLPSTLPSWWKAAPGGVSPSHRTRGRRRRTSCDFHGS